MRDQLRRRRLWRGESEFRSLLRAHDQLLVAVDAADGKVDPEWPARQARLANVVLAARARGRLDAEIERARTANPNQG